MYTSQQRHRPDLRLAESYIPAALLVLKNTFYTLIVPVFLNTSESLQPTVISIFMCILYVDHIYFLLQGHTFLDTTAVAVDIMTSTLYMLLSSRLCYFWCFVILGSWGLTSISYILVINTKLTLHDMHRRIVHLVTFIFFISFVSLHSSGGVIWIEDNAAASLHFFSRSLFYTILVLIDAYFIRPPFLQEIDRYFMCKFGAVLFATWQLAAILFCGLLLAQIMVVSQIRIISEEPTLEKQDLVTHNISVDIGDNNLLNPQLLSLMSINKINDNNETNIKIDDRPKEDNLIPNNIAELDVMEAFRIAKLQYSSHHGLKIN